MASVGSTPDPLIGRLLSHYRIEGQIGSGGMGVVYRAHDEHLDRKVALKVLLPGTIANEPARRKFRNEALTLSKLNHPNIAIVHDFDTDNDLDFLVMELIEGVTLSAKLLEGSLPQKDVVALGAQMADGLTAAHDRGVIHRDLKPANLRITADGRCKILDFGLAKLRLSAKACAATETVSETSLMAGTLPYMAPEQVLGGEIDARTDIHAAGTVLYQMATGLPPCQSQDRSELINEVLRSCPLPPDTVNPRLSPELARIITKCLEREPENRYQSTKELAIDLRHLERERENRYQSARELHIDLQRLLTAASAPSAVVPTRRRRARGGVTSIAILPLVNAGVRGAEHVSDGVIENIIDKLSHLPKLRVMARSTVFRYKDLAVDPIVVGRELGVEAVLVGRLVQRGDSLTIKTELVDVTDGAQIWGGQYNCNLTDIFSVQEEIATGISSRLCPQLTSAEKQCLGKHYTENREAYQAYLRGRYMAGKYTKEGMKKSIEYFRQAIEIDPAFALAYAGLAMAYWNVSAVQFAPTEVMPKARQASRKALEIDPQLAESHAAVALVKMAYEWDREDAEREFKRAMELNQGYSTVYQWHGWHLAIMGRLEESIEELGRAQELDPLSEINTYIGLSHYWARQYDLAIEQFQKALELYPGLWLPHLYLGWTRLQQGDLSRANGHLVEALGLEDNTWTVASLAHAAAVVGDRSRAEELLKELLQRTVRQFVSPYFVARIHMGLGEIEQAFAWLQKAYEGRDECLTWLKVDPAMESLHADARYAELLHRVGLAT